MNILRIGLITLVIVYVFLCNLLVSRLGDYFEHLVIRCTVVRLCVMMLGLVLRLIKLSVFDFWFGTRMGLMTACSCVGLFVVSFRVSLSDIGFLPHMWELGASSGDYLVRMLLFWILAGRPRMMFSALLLLRLSS